MQKLLLQIGFFAFVAVGFLFVNPGSVRAQLGDPVREIGRAEGNVYMMWDNLRIPLSGVQMHMQMYLERGGLEAYCVTNPNTVGHLKYYNPAFAIENGYAGCFRPNEGALGLTDSNGHYVYGKHDGGRVDSLVLCVENEGYTLGNWIGQYDIQFTQAQSGASRVVCQGRPVTYSGLSCGANAYRWTPYFPQNYNLAQVINNPAIYSQIAYRQNELFGGGRFTRRDSNVESGVVITSPAQCKVFYDIQHGSNPSAGKNFFCDNVLNNWILFPPPWSSQTSDYSIDSNSFIAMAGFGNTTLGNDFDFEWQPTVSGPVQCTGMTSNPAASNGQVTVSSATTNVQIGVNGSDADGAIRKLSICWAIAGQPATYYARGTAVYRCQETNNAQGSAFNMIQTYQQYLDQVPNPDNIAAATVRQNGLVFVTNIWDEPTQAQFCSSNTLSIANRPASSGVLYSSACAGNLASCPTCQLGTNNCRLTLRLVETTPECSALTVNGQSSFTVTRGDAYTLNLATTVTPAGATVATASYQYSTLNAGLGSIAGNGATGTWTLTAAQTQALTVGTVQNAARVQIAGSTRQCPVSLVVQDAPEVPQCSTLTADGQSTVTVARGQGYTFDLATTVTPQGISVNATDYVYDANIGTVNGTGPTPEWVLTAADVAALPDGQTDNAVTVTIGSAENGVICPVNITVSQTAPACGDNSCDTGETCEFESEGGAEYACNSDGTRGDDLTAGSCRTATCDYCGDGTVDEDEQCEIGEVNEETGQTCTAACEWGPAPQCGSTCESNIQCPDGMFCNGEPGTPGVCRNPSCPDETDCTCNPDSPLCNDTCTDNSECPSTMQCIGGSCRNPECSTQTNCVCNEPPPELPGTGLDDRGFSDKIVFGVLLMLGGVILYKLGFGQVIVGDEGRSKVGSFVGLITRKLSKREYNKRKIEDSVDE